MRKIISLVVVLAIIGIFFTQGTDVFSKVEHLFSYSFCSEPIKYHVDTVDPEFKLTKEQFLKDINQASEIWNNVEGKNLFVYDPKGELSINMIYDERQSLTNEIGQLENTVKKDQTSIKPQIAEYEKLSSDFKQNVSQLNQEINDWNSKGGAPSEVYDGLISRQKELNSQADRLNEMARNLNQSSSEINSQVGKLNQTIDSFNETLQERPEEGIYKGPENRIEIYFNVNQKELIHTLAHELGHSIGLGHVKNPKSIMYAKTSQTLTPTDEDIIALKEICRERSFFEMLQIYFNQRFKTTN